MSIISKYQKSTVLVILIILTGLIHSYGQSQAIIDSSAIMSWPTLGKPMLSPLGDFVAYSINNQPKGSKTFVIQSTKSNWNRTYEDGSDIFTASFSSDSKFILSLNPQNKLRITRLGTDVSQTLTNVRSFKTNNGVRSYIAYLSNDSISQLTVKELGQSRSFNCSFVSDYWFFNSGRNLLYKTGFGNGRTERLINVDLFTGSQKVVWEGSRLENLVLDKKASQIAFISIVASRKTIWVYKAHQPIARRIFDAEFSTSGGLILQSIEGFSAQADRLFIKLENSKLPEKRLDLKLNIWSYRDSRLQSQQLEETGQTNYTASLNLLDLKLVLLESDRERLFMFDMLANYKDEWLLLRDNSGAYGESNWNKDSAAPMQVISSLTGEKRLVCKKGGNKINIFSFKVSPGNRFVVYYDPEERSYFSFETSSGILRNITQNTRTEWLKDKESEARPYTFKIAGWGKDDKTVFLYDKYDIWEADLRGENSPVCLTNQHGYKNKVGYEFISDVIIPIDGAKEIILSCFNYKNKQNGFCSIIRSNPVVDPKPLKVEDALFYAQVRTSRDAAQAGMMPLRAEEESVYVVSKMTAGQSQNYYLTRNFKDFKQLSALNPEQKYNWISAELHSIPNVRDSVIQGVLYKPNNFDSNKKYPVVINYYETVSNNLNVFFQPRFSDGRLNIPFFVSNGYLVFTPDINHVIGFTGESALNSVSAAREYLSKLNFVDSTRIGLQGISFGGFETNYIVCNTTGFAAVSSSAGVSDLISFYGDLKGGGFAVTESVEQGQFRMGSSIWDNKEAYLKNSPILSADKVQSPLLLMHTTVDATIPFRQALELFIALRRLGKTAWLLEYEDGNHGVWGNSAVDFTTRLIQFFDHYLKNMPAPLWMIEGRNAQMKFTEDKLQLDSLGRKPGPGLSIN